MILDNLEQLKEHISAAIGKEGKICILTHKNPDGDGFCAALALKKIFHCLTIQADIVVEEPVSHNFDFLNAKTNYRVYTDLMLYETVIILDCHEEERIGRCAPLILSAKNIIAIDHHQQQELIANSRNFIDTGFVSVGAVIFQLYEDEISRFPAADAEYISQAIYATIVNDTDNFINMNTSAAAFSLCSRLMNYNITPGAITEKLLYNQPAGEIRFIGEALQNILTFDEDQILFILATREMMEKHDLQYSEVKKLTRWVKGTRNVKVIVSFLEIHKNRYRLSLRSNYMDVSKIAVKYGGGGHKKAAGCEIKAAWSDLQKMILADIRQLLNS
jgi:phosphoesterase RecJ-like protein